MTRRVLALLASTAGALALAPAAGAATSSGTSANWSGYVSTRASGFTRVSATWTVPSVDCSAGAGYSAAWVGLGGVSTSVDALEQAGTESDCSAGGQASYSAWYELIPDAGHDLALTVRAGDKVSTSVEVHGHRVVVRMADKTTGASVTKKLTAATVDTSSADWIVEAPSLCSSATVSEANCTQSALANFASTRFAHARATSTYGHKGAITDASWSTTALSLVPSVSEGRFARDVSSGSAVPSTLNTSADSFAVSYTSSTPTTAAARLRPAGSTAAAG